MGPGNMCEYVFKGVRNHSPLFRIVADTCKVREVGRVGEGGRREGGREGEREKGGRERGRKGGREGGILVEQTECYETKYV